MTIPVAGGPAGARNLGAGQAGSDLLFFVDADVAVPPDAVSRVKNNFTNNPGLAAVFGSYDDEPSETNFLSQYKNLFHHYVHQNSREESSSFWAACGAVRRDVFLEMGGFEKSYKGPMIEDVELGLRMKRSGHRILLDKGLQVKHLKHWSLSSLLEADFFFRALPWTALILRNRFLINDLNLKTGDRLSTVLVYVLIMGLAGSLYYNWLLSLAALSGLGLIAINWRLYAFFMRKRGFKFLLMAIPWHWFYFLYSGFAFLVGLLRYGINRILKNGL